MNSKMKSLFLVFFFLLSSCLHPSLFIRSTYFFCLFDNPSLVFPQLVTSDSVRISFKIWRNDNRCLGFWDNNDKENYIYLIVMMKN